MQAQGGCDMCRAPHLGSPQGPPIASFQLQPIGFHLLMLVKDTDKGTEIKTQIADLKKLLYAYHTGVINAE